jgi:glycosyltransferase involved in cell wall biosynthesis
MRIAYITRYLDNVIMRGGVGRKIRSQIQFWQMREQDVHLFVLSPDEISEDNCSVFQYHASTSLPILRDLSRTISRSRAVLKLIEGVQNFRPDLIYLRFGRYIYPFHRLYKLAPIILELNTDDINEDRHLGWLLYWFNRLTRGLVFKNASGLIALSQEIAELPANKIYGKPVRVIANGIDLEQYPPLPPPKNDRPVITLVGSPGMIWHGVDKLICLAEKCSDLKINIVGYQPPGNAESVPTNIQFHGFLDRAGIIEVLMKTDIACGSLAMHRNDMTEASPLKVREALAYGIPVLLGYKDTDLSTLESEYILQIPNTEDNVLVYAGQIRSFAYSMMGKRINRDAIISRIDQGPKEETRLAFFDEIIRNSGVKLHK